jgi:hypothetical protein
MYRRVKHNGVSYRVHRVVWEMHNGPIPEGLVVDHVNGNGLDNRIENLRLVTLSENQRNTKLRKDSTTGVRGIGWHKATQKWIATIRVNNKTFYLGVFSTLLDAVAARLRAERLYDFMPTRVQ